MVAADRRTSDQGEQSRSFLERGHSRSDEDASGAQHASGEPPAAAEEGGVELSVVARHETAPTFARAASRDGTLCADEVAALEAELDSEEAAEAAAAARRKAKRAAEAAVARRELYGEEEALEYERSHGLVR